MANPLRHVVKPCLAGGSSAARTKVGGGRRIAGLLWTDRLTPTGIAQGRWNGRPALGGHGLLNVFCDLAELMQCAVGGPRAKRVAKTLNVTELNLHKIGAMAGRMEFRGEDVPDEPGG